MQKAFQILMKEKYNSNNRKHDILVSIKLMEENHERFCFF